MTDTTIPAPAQLQAWLDGNTSTLSKAAVRTVLWDLAEAQVALEQRIAAPVHADIYAEQVRQVVKFGEQHREDGTGGPVMRDMAEDMRNRCNYLAENGGADWRAVLLEEVYEAMAESDPAKLRAELVQVAAVCATWVQDIDSRTAGS
ncbi:MAG: hypothetical protein HOY79_17555 [Streptomyces sp.]|nr:hypothetical protein [Streptomyces sp.]